jgi:hypothetical protein
MAYAALSTIQTIATGQPFTAATLQQANDNDEFLIDPPACSIMESTAQSLADNTATTLTSNEENFDNDSMHSTATNTTRITAQTAGRYVFFATVSFAANATGHRVLRLLVNNTTSYDLQVVNSSTAATPIVLSGSKTLVLAASSYVECVAAQNSGGALNVTLLDLTAVYITR